MKRALVWLTAGLCVPSAVMAVSTSSFVIDTAETFEKGKLEGTAVHASGMLTRAVTTERTSIEEVPVAYASAVGPDQAIYVGTGNEGAVYRVDAQGPKLFADTDAALITSLVWVDRTLYAASMPGGRVFAIDDKGKVREHARLEGADHVWAIGFDPRSKLLYAATGPEGKLFSVNLKGESKLIHDDAAEHLLSLDLDAQGRVYVGTSNGARLLRIEGGKASVLYDFPGQEITALDVGKSGVVVAANEFPEPPPPGGADNNKDAATARLRRPKPGKGRVYKLSADGQLSDLFGSDNGHISALEFGEDERSVQIGLAQEGRIVRVDERGARALWADADERQVVALALTGKAPHFVTSDGVAVYRVRAGDKEGTWTSAVLDARVPARFGELSVRARGVVRWATRSGNTEKPDDSWSAWSAESSEAAPIRSPGARFLQVRATLVGDAELYGLSAYYLPQNQPARVRNIRVRPPKANTAKGESAPVHHSQLTLAWDVDNPDDDRLRYRVFYRREGHSQFLPALREHERLEQPSYDWETRTLPDGYYRVRVEVSDELSNPEPFVLRTDAYSGPLRVDNHAPEIRGLKVQGKRLVGEVHDALGPVQALEISVDGAPFKPIAPVDGMLDTRSERFEVELSSLAPGAHVIAVRATDAAHNVGVDAIEIKVER